MNKNTGALLKDIRNIKRNTSMFPSPQDIITSAKELKKIKSTQQINVNTFMDNKNEKIKNIDQKLQVHQNQINKNNQMIEQLTNNFISMKEQMVKEKEKTLSQEKKNKLLKEQIQRTNKLLRAKTLKVDELTKKMQNLQKEIQGNKTVLIKNQQLTNTLIKLRGQMATTQETLSESKIKLQEKQKQILRQKEKLSEIDYLQSKISQLQAQLGAKDSIINNYKITIHEFTTEKDKDISKKLVLQTQIQKWKSELDQIKKAKLSTQKAYQMSQKRLSQTSKRLQLLECERDVAQSKMKNHESEQSRVRTLYQQINKKNEELIQVHNTKMQEFNSMTNKYQKIQQRAKDLEIQLGQARDQKNKLQNVEITFNQLKKRSKNLETVYNSIIPQIQCPFGHELCNPVTIIPCGHNYCLGCKKGYQKECSQCKGKLKIQAVYRNQLMDDIIGIIGSVKVVVQLFKQK